MNIFEHRVFINDKPYSIHVDSSKDEWKKIIINNTVVVDEKYTLSLNKDAYIIYYPVYIEDQEIVLSIDDTALQHSYDIYMNGISLLNGKTLDCSYSAAKSNISKGFGQFFKKNWFSILKDNIVDFLISTIVLFSLGIYTTEKWFYRIILILIAAPCTLPLFVVAEWIHNKNIIKKYKKCFRSKIVFDANHY